MAVDQGKSAFVRELLGRDPEADEQAVNEAWQKAGNQGTISGSLIYKIRSGLGLTGKGRSADVAAGRPKAKATKGPKDKPVAQAQPESNGPPAESATGPESTAGNRGRTLDRVEDRIDEIIFELKDLGGMEQAQEALRLARRLVVRSHEG
jgi:hypothetical protein